MENQLITIIIPVYNVKMYLDRCLKSVIEQTYRNIEIIVVDDGSTDGSDEICDKWATIDDRVIVIHKENGGLSDARNRGLDLAKGEYISFVDSDDFIFNDFIEVLYQKLITYQVQIASCNYHMFENMDQINRAKKDESTVIFENEKAIVELLTDKTYRNYVCNKLFKRELFSDIRFPVGRKMEDLGTTYKLILKSGKIAYCSTALYCYFQRADSILHTVDDKIKYDKYFMSYQRYEEIKKYYPNLLENDVFMLDIILDVYPYLVNQYQIEWDEILSKIPRKTIYNMSCKSKLKYCIFITNRKLYCKIFLWRKKHGSRKS